MKIYHLNKLGNIAADDRGWMAELSQFAISNGYKIENIHIGSIAAGQIRGNHVHKKQKEWVFVFGGKSLIAWKENGEIEKTEVASDEYLLFEFEENCPHAIKNICDHEIFACAFANQEYNATNPDRFFEKLLD